MLGFNICKVSTINKMYAVLYSVYKETEPFQIEISYNILY